MDDTPPVKRAKLGEGGVGSEAQSSPENFNNHETSDISPSKSSSDFSPTPGCSSNGLDLPGTSHDSQDDDDDDNVSIISGMSDMSGKGWKPDMSGELGWLARARSRGIDPRDVISDLMQGGDSGMLTQMDDNTIWMILFKMFAQPPRREKLKDFNTLEDVARHIKHARKILVLTGAGVSVSCGIPDFRSKDGVYARLAVDFPDLPDPQAMFDIQYFRKDPRPFFKFAKEIYPGQFTPSPCHRFIHCLEREGKLLRNYTQNIDTLEQVAGISRVVQCHGSFATASCTICRQKQEAHTIREDIMEQKIPLCPKCPSPNLQEILDRLHIEQETKKELERKRLQELASLEQRDLESKRSPDQLGAGISDSNAPEAGYCNTPGPSSETGSSNPGPSSEAGFSNPGPSSSQQQSSNSDDQPSQSKLDPPQTRELETQQGDNPTPSSSKQEDEASPSTLSPGKDATQSNPTPPSAKSLFSLPSMSPFVKVPIMKPDIVFFGEGLSDQFHKTISEDKDEVDLLIVIGSSLKVRPVALIPSSIPKHIPQVLINRERLSHMTFDVELLGDCDVVINQLCHMLEGDWSPGIHRPILEQTLVLPMDLDQQQQQGHNNSKDNSLHNNNRKHLNLKRTLTPVSQEKMIRMKRKAVPMIQ
eukprot:TRINITY_DN7849_c0_g1_i11.p1 TRINITY_DN7849_c0_g1~~TRINITY_DN7849_c0_g1_i11.p1  ORF type:complete len:645 (-),score=148.26 TRINITY_DN7849_c0_g1_i11:618-2552(-)